MKILIEIAYVGTSFAGFQVQPSLPTVQSALQDALERVYGERYPVKGCSRTDSGVHARQYFATYDTDRALPCDRIPLALNSSLPEDISVRSARVVPDEFHVRHDVEMKEYEYIFHASKIRDPFLRGRVCETQPLSDEQLGRMRDAASRIVGRKDFASFMASGSKIADTVRDVKYCELTRDGELVKLRIAADGFLYNMVRIIAGTLLDVARGRFEPEELDAIISARDRSRAGFTAPPEGLYLAKVLLKL